MVLNYIMSNDENFHLCVDIMWIIHDFSAYGMISGWTSKGKMACTPYKKPNWLYKFDGTWERDLAPKILLGEEILLQLNNVHESKKMRKRVEEYKT